MELIQERHQIVLPRWGFSAINLPSQQRLEDFTPGEGGIHPMMAYMERLRPKGVSFQASDI